VCNHDHTILCYRRVELERAHARGQSRLESRQRILGGDSARATVTLQIEIGADECSPGTGLLDGEG
jgi:hypothetical protein